VAEAVSPVYRGGRRQGATRSSKEYNTTTYYCTGGAGKARAEAEVARTGLGWLPDGGHGPVLVESAAPGMVRCPLCGLTKPVGYKRRRAIRDAGITEADISRPPF
jgi:hypothetical protein